MDLQKENFILAGPTTNYLRPPEAFRRRQTTNFKLTMAYWLVKSEPSAYSWEQLEKDKQTNWTGVRNYAARNHLKAMKKGDDVFFYHSNEGLNIVGIAKVAKEAYQDPTTEETAWVCVDLKPYKKLKNPVSLDTIKKEKRLKDMALVRIGRLSVQPVTEKEHDVILELAGEKK
jgi:predicted RNA-binding protein with PUA-like domain